MNALLARLLRIRIIEENADRIIMRVPRWLTHAGRLDAMLTTMRDEIKLTHGHDVTVTRAGRTIRFDLDQ